MTSGAYALVEDGTSRVFLFIGPGPGVIRALDGTWLEKPRSTADVVMPDELDDFRRASNSEFLVLLQEAAVSFPDNSSVAKTVRSALMFDWDKVTDFCWWDGMPAVLVRDKSIIRAFSISSPDREWRPVNAAEVHDESRRIPKSSFESLLDDFMAGGKSENNQPATEKQRLTKNSKSLKDWKPSDWDRPLSSPEVMERRRLQWEAEESEEAQGGPIMMPSND